MLPHRLALTSHLWHLRGRKLHLSGALAGALLLAAVTAGCGASTHPPTPTPTATSTPPPPTSAGVYVLTPHALDVLSLADGTLQRTFPYDNPSANTQGPLAIAGGAAYFVTNGAPANSGTIPIPGAVVALRATNGHVLWRFSFPTTPTPFPNNPSTAFLASIVNGNVYVVVSVYASPDTFYALSAQDGHVLWQIQEAVIREPATVVDGVVYLSVQVQDGTQHLLALRATDGTQLWDSLIPTCGVLHTPAVDNGMVFLSCGLFMGEGDVYGVRASDGVLLWHRDSLGFFVSAPVATNGLGYVFAGGCGYVEQPPCPPPFYLYAFDEQSGALRWRTQSCSGYFNVIDGVLSCILPDSLVVLDPATGAVRMSYPLPTVHVQRRESQDTIAGGVIYFEGDEQIFAISLATSAVLWHSPTLVEQSNPTIAIFVVPQA